MRFFSSHRERRLWLWTLAVVVAIYSTLGLTGMLAGLLREHGLGAPLFLLFMFLVAATVVTHGIKARAGRAEIAVGLGVATAYLLVLFPHVDSGGAVAPHRIRRSGRLDLRSTRRAREPGAPRPVAATARRCCDYGARRARRGHPVVSAHSRLRPAGHPVQLPCGRYGGRLRASRWHGRGGGRCPAGRAATSIHLDGPNNLDLPTVVQMQAVLADSSHRPGQSGNQTLQSVGDGIFHRVQHTIRK